MKVANLITTETPGTTAPTQSGAGAAFGLILESVGNAEEQPAPEAMTGKGEPKLPLVMQSAAASTPAIEETGNKKLQPKVEEEEALKGSGDDLEHQKMWQSADELVDFTAEKNGQAMQAPQTPVKDQAEAVAEPELETAKSDDKATVDANSVALVAPVVQIEAQPVEKKAAAGAVDAIATEAGVPKAPTKTEQTLADPEWAHPAEIVAEKASEPVAAPVKAGRKAIEVANASGAATHAVKMLHTLDLIDDAEEVVVLEGEVITSDEQGIDAEVVAKPQAEGRTNARSGEDKPASPVNLGKPVLAMVTQEMLQENIAGRNEGVPAAFPTGITSVQAPSAPISGHQLSTVPHATLLHHVSLPTTEKHMAPDVGAALVRSIDAGKNEVSIRLDPVELGRVEIRMTFSEDGRMRAVIAADNPSTFDLLKRDADVLVKTLSDAGVKTDAGDLRFDMRQQSQPGQQGDERQAKTDRYAGDNTGKGGDVAADEKPKAVRSTRGRLV